MNHLLCHRYAAKNQSVHALLPYCQCYAPKYRSQEKIKIRKSVIDTWMNLKFYLCPETKKSASKSIDPVILNVFQDPLALDIRS